MARAVFKTVVGGDEPPRWVRLPCALAKLLLLSYLERGRSVLYSYSPVLCAPRRSGSRKRSGPANAGRTLALLCQGSRLEPRPRSTVSFLYTSPRGVARGPLDRSRRSDGLPSASHGRRAICLWAGHLQDLAVWPLRPRPPDAEMGRHRSETRRNQPVRRSRRNGAAIASHHRHVRSSPWRRRCYAVSPVQAQ